MVIKNQNAEERYFANAFRNWKPGNKIIPAVRPVPDEELRQYWPDYKLPPGKKGKLKK